MQLEKQRDGTWIVRNANGDALGTLDGRFGSWVARSGDRVLGICQSRQSAETLVRAHVTNWRRG